MLLMLLGAVALVAMHGVSAHGLLHDHGLDHPQDHALDHHTGGGQEIATAATFGHGTEHHHGSVPGGRAPADHAVQPDLVVQPDHTVGHHATDHTTDHLLDHRADDGVAPAAPDHDLAAHSGQRPDEPCLACAAGSAAMCALMLLTVAFGPRRSNLSYPIHAAARPRRPIRPWTPDPPVPRLAPIPC